MIKKFKSDESANVLTAFAIAISVLTAGAATAVDYSNLSSTKTALQSSLDAAMLMAGRDALATGRRIQTAEVISYMESNLKPHLRQYAKNVVIEQSAEKLSATLKATVTHRFGAIIGVEKTDLGVGASIPLGATRLEVALVLDTTGSMGDFGKMDTLKAAATELVNTLVSGKISGSEVAFAVVPFTTQVRVSNGSLSASWIDFPNGNPNPKHNSSPATWDGCIMDRDKPFNTKKHKPNKVKKEELFPAQNCATPGLAPIQPLTTNVSTTLNSINALTPDGNTNTTIGMAWGYNVLTPGNPLSDGAASEASHPARVLVFLTDGLNTEDRFGQSPTLMDVDMRELCKSAATSDIRVFTIRVVDGNDSLLRDCASSPDDFYTTNDAAGLKKIFQSIAGKLMRLRLSS